MAGTQVETIDRYCLLAPALAYAQLLSYIAQAQLPRDSAAPTPNWLGPHRPSINQDTLSKTWP